ncbi:MAG: hypothetical protein BGO78_09030 [Chloroflexi bacterium 44-23]|nr:MAG: hypothetical protein BGO78_09030 [Chloroflexi bacterium 44-23]
MKYLLSLDIGTTSVKAGLFDSEGRCLSIAAQEYLLLTPAAERAELDPETYWLASVSTLRQVISKSGIESNGIVAITVSSQGETIIVLDEVGKPLLNAIVWIDNRAVKQAEYLDTVLGKDAYEHTGIPEIIPTWPACKILWLKENEPALFARTAKFLLVQDYLIYRLTGHYVTDGSISCTTLYFDINRHEWWQDALDEIGIEKEKLASIQKPGSIAGRLTKESMDALNLPTPIAVVCGGMDQSVGAIGAGTIKEGVVSETTGAALAIQVCIDNPLIDDKHQTPVYVHSIDGMYLFVPVCPTAGMAFKWFKDNFFLIHNQSETIQTELDYYEKMNEMSAQIPAGSDGLVMLPHLMGAFSPESNPFARGSFTGFTLSHTKSHFVRAIQEAVAFMLRQNIEMIQHAGVFVKEIRTGGGASRSHIWNQIKADVLNVPIVKLENGDTALVGNAILGGVAVNVFETIEEGCQKMVQIKSRTFPSKDSAQYEIFFRRYLDLDSTLKEYFKRNYSI